jgi:YHS domain-containing protein
MATRWLSITATVMIFATACERSEQLSASPPVPIDSAPATNTTVTPAAASLTPAPLPPTGPLTLVTDRSLVCMVNNQFMGRPQIPVVVNGNTYYGCCEMCKGRLANDPTSRTAVDPVSKHPVDKAVAVIGRAENGTTVYFENDQNFAAYSAR